MIKAKEVVKEYIRAQATIDDLAKTLKVTRQTLHNILNDENVSSEVIGKILEKTGFVFEKAFEIEEPLNRRKEDK